MTPERDPATCQALEDAVRDIAAQSARPWVHPESMRDDPGYVPPRVTARLSGVAARHGFTVRRADFEAEYPGQRTRGLLGMTGGAAVPTPNTIHLRRGMSPASEARTLGHEVAHILLGHVGHDWVSSYKITCERLRRGGEDPQQEVAAELATGAFCQLAGIGTGWFSPDFINGKTGGRPIPEETIMAGLLGARILWAAVAPALERTAA